LLIIIHEDILASNKKDFTFAIPFPENRSLRERVSEREGEERKNIFFQKKFGD
jgi:hypothetical protein